MKEREWSDEHGTYWQVAAVDRNGNLHSVTLTHDTYAGWGPDARETARTLVAQAIAGGDVRREP